MEVLQVAQHIEAIIGSLKAEGHRSTQLINDKAQSLSDYDKGMGVATATLKAEGLAVTLISSQAKARCSDALKDKIVAEEVLKAHYCRIEILKAQLNGYQSIYRHLQSTG